MAHDDAEVAWLQGYVAGYAGQPLTTNPYRDEPELPHAWTEGWREGRADNLRESRQVQRRA